MLNIKDIVTLAASGYKKDDIKELIELSKQSEAEPEKKTPETPPETPGAEQEKKEPEQDFEKLYNEQLKINSDLQASLKAAQGFNQKKDVSNNADPLEEMQKLFR